MERERCLGCWVGAQEGQEQVERALCEQEPPRCGLTWPACARVRQERVTKCASKGARRCVYLRLCQLITLGAPAKTQVLLSERKGTRGEKQMLPLLHFCS